MANVRRRTAPTGMSGAIWERDWRADVTSQLSDISRQGQATAVILERISGQLDSHDKRIEALEKQPTAAAARRAMDTNLALYVVLTCVSITSLLITLAGHLALFWR